MAKKDIFKLNDTIAALATFPQPAAIGVIKISGPKALDIAAKIFQPAKAKNIKKVPTYTLHYGWVKEKDRVIDEVLLAVMRAPSSYTRQDVVEIHTHSGPLVLEKVLRLVLKAGARLAEPGEFSKRAYLLGRIDLIQAEAIENIVAAKSEAALQMGISQLKGELSRKIDSFIRALEDLTSLFFAALNFPQEEIEIDPNDCQRQIAKLSNEMAKLLSASFKVRPWREGVKCVLCGRANVGKSSLFNAWLEKERVLVSALAGTTRDVVEEEMMLKGICVRIYDTAGLGKVKDTLAQPAQEKSYEVIAEADILLVLLDNSLSLSKEEENFIRQNRQKAILVVNKCDLKRRLNIKALAKYRLPLVEVSAQKKKGLRKLEEAVLSKIKTASFNKKADIYLGSLRQEQELAKAKDFLQNALQELKSNAWDKTYFFLQASLDKLYNIKGKNFSPDLLDRVFKNFCIGK